MMKKINEQMKKLELDAERLSKWWKWIKQENKKG
jgi:hypothetical protein